MSEREEKLQASAPVEENKNSQPAETAATEEAPRRRRRAEKYAEDSGEHAAPNYTAQPALSSSSETAREVANRYRQRQAAAQEDMGRTMIQPARALTGEARPRQGSAPTERVGYPAGRMGMDATQRARMSENGRARLAEESQNRQRMAYPGAESARGQDSRYVGRPVIAEKKTDGGRGHKGLKVLVVVLLVIVACLVAMLVMPEDSALGGLRQNVIGMLGGAPTPAPVNISLSLAENSGREAPGYVDFLAVTGKGVADVRLLDENGNVLPCEENVVEAEEEIRWAMSWYAEEAYIGEVRLQTLAQDQWMDTEARVQVALTLRPTPEPEVTELPVAFMTEAPTATPVPTATPTPTAVPSPEEEPLEEEELDAEKEGLGEDAIGALDPDDPGDTWDTEETDDAAEEDAAPFTAQEQWEDIESKTEEEETEAIEAASQSEEETATIAETLPTAEPAATTAEEPTLERRLLTASAGENADPSLIATTVVYNGTKKVVEYARSDKEKIHMPTLGEYTKQKIGVLTFRNDAFRQNAAVGTVKGMDSLEMAWTAEAGSIKGASQTYYGIGWVGQPAIVKWSKEVREQSEMYDSKKEKSGLKEVIVGGLDGRIYFLDLSDGSATRNSIKLGFPMKASPSVHPGGAPYMTVGQFARKMAGKQGTIGLRQYNLYMLKELSLIDGLDGKNNRPYNTVGSFETSALIDRTTGCMITAGTNGMLYLINLNSEFDYNAGTYTQSPSTVVMKSKAKGEKEASTAVEASIAMYDRYVYYADVGGFLRCVDTNSLTPVWAVSLGDTVESTPALDWHGEDGLDLYTATELATRKKGDAEIKCFDALTGEERWTAAFGVKKDTKNKTISGFRASPVVGQNGLSEYVYYTVNNLSDAGQEQLGLGSETAALICLRKADGEVVWARGLSGRGYSSPVAVYDEAGNGAIIQCAGDGSILMLDGVTGQERAALQIDGTIEASPAVFDSMMVIGTTEKNKNNIYGIRIE
ncbi:MAG: PQQ-like beta-propeller repeat protein [Clostridia bacterium]|nr:PQQ-like beta-propeller repeat protein [Clostridia bacterium]